MNPIPTDVAVPVSAYTDPIMLIAVVASFIVFAMMLWGVRSTMQRRERRVCPERHRRAHLLVALGPAGNAVDVLRCSLLGRGPVTCAKGCLTSGPE